MSDPSAEMYLRDALEIIRTNAFVRSRCDWVSIEKAAFKRLQAGNTIQVAHETIREILDSLGDGHSFLSPATTELSVANGERDRTNPKPERRMLADSVGYIKLYHFSGSERAAIELADETRRLIAELESQGATSWVVDLSDNKGGNMWPMIAGLGQLLGKGTVGYFVDSDGNRMEWRYENGQGICDGECVVCATLHASDSDLSACPVVVMTSKATASSGEAVTVAFAGRPKTLRVGQATAGLSTANQNFDLSDGSVIYLTVAVFADRLGRTYGERIKPDIEVEANPEKMIAEALRMLAIPMPLKRS